MLLIFQISLSVLTYAAVRFPSRAFLLSPFHYLSSRVPPSPACTLPGILARVQYAKHVWLPLHAHKLAPAWRREWHSNAVPALSEIYSSEVATGDIRQSLKPPDTNS